MVSFGSARLAAAIVVVSASAVLAQVVPSVSTDPLNGSTFSTPFFSVTPTYTITSTFPNAGSTTPTAVGGPAGPSPATGAYSYSFNAPVSSLSGVVPSSLYASLAANGQPTQYTAPFQPDNKDLQIVDGAYLNDIPFMAIGSMAIAGTLAALWVL